MILSCIVAMAENRVIGANNRLPWHLPEDLKYFKRVTLGHPIIMGRKTFDSIGRALPGRANIVVTRQANWHADGVVIAGSIDESLHKADAAARAAGVDEVFLIGGEELFRQAWRHIQRLYLTQVHAEVEGDAYFPEFQEAEWREIRRVDHQSDESNPFAYSFIVLDRCTSQGFPTLRI